MAELAPSILSADFSHLGEDVEKVENCGLKILHIDVMDGNFVPAISFGEPVIRSIRKQSKMEFDVHLMIEKPERYLSYFAKAGADSITVHAETCAHLHRVIQAVKDTGCKCGVALNPATPLEVLDYVLEDVDMVLLMTVNPGFGGQKFIPQMLRKIEILKKRMEKENPSAGLEVDGGINNSTIKDVIKAGADILVAGSAIFDGNIAENIENLQKLT